MKFSEFISLVNSDFYRYDGDISLRSMIRHRILTPGVRYTFYFRFCQYLNSKPLKAFGLYYLIKFIYLRVGIRYGMDIAASTKIGRGFYIGHFGAIVINPGTVIGDNCNLSHEVTIGQMNRGPKAGCPTIGNNVFIGPGAKIMGKIKIGDNAAIGANAVVVDDVPENGVAVGIPARIISLEGSAGYISHTDY